MRMTTTLVQLGVTDPAVVGSARRRAGGDDALIAAAVNAGREVGVSAAVLSTCERFEVYGLGEDAQVAALAGRCADLLAADGAMRRRIGPAAVHHLFAVAAGLESRFVGEEHIQGQVSRSRVAETEAPERDAVLARLVQASVASARRVRAASGLAHLGGGCVDAVVMRVRAERLRRGAAGVRVALLGSGALAREIAGRLLADGVGGVTVMARHPERAAEALGVHAAAGAVLVRGLDAKRAVLDEADVIIAATSSPTFLIDAADVAASDAGAATTRVMMDLGVPSNIDPAVAGMSGVTLVTLSALMPADAGVDAIVSRAREQAAQAAERWSRRWLVGVEVDAARAGPAGRSGVA